MFFIFTDTSEFILYMHYRLQRMKALQTILRLIYCTLKIDTALKQYSLSLQKQFNAICEFATIDDAGKAS